MHRRVLAIALVGLFLSGCVGTVPRALPATMASLGDSLTRAFNSDAPGDRVASSWSTGTDPTDGVLSLAERLHAASRGTLTVVNLAESGARMDDLPAQAARAVEQRAEFVTILMGANDACRRSVEQMTSVDAFRAQFQEAARVLREGLPIGAVVYVLSIPNVTHVWESQHEREEARRLWDLSRPCQVLLAPQATAMDRAAVGLRIDAFNAVLAEEARRAGFWWDGGALSRGELGVADLSRFDAFHPSSSGQAKLAQTAWDAGPYA